MDDYSGKRAGEGVVSRNGSRPILRDTANTRDPNARMCNRIGCSGRLNSPKINQVGFKEKAKSSRPSFRTSNSKETVGSSSRSCTTSSKPRKIFTESQKKLSAFLETDSSETSSIQDEPDTSEFIPPPGKIQRGFHLDSGDGESGKAMFMEVGSSSSATDTRSKRYLSKKSVVGNQGLTSPSISGGSKSTGQGTRASASRYGLRSLRCNSISDAIPSGCSSLDSSIGRRKDVVKKRNSEGESSSSAKGKKISGPLVDGRNSSSGHGISISELRRTRNSSFSKDSVAASVRTRRPTGCARARLSGQGSGNGLLNMESPLEISQVPQTEMLIDMNSPSPSQHFTAETSFDRPPSFSHPGGSSGNLRGTTSAGSSEIGVSRSLTSRDSFRHYNIDGIAEVLLALERIEQEEELTYEQLLVLETNLFLNGLNFYDQHRDMRLDIDNMSYEELLALEERIGTVSTALTEEALSKCLKRSIYQPISFEDGASASEVKDDIKCSICQEEYVDGDEVGGLPCEHIYHVECIHQWLRMKNWCPICKASAELAGN